MLRLRIESPDRQEAIGATLSSVCPNGSIIYLHGELGAGKTTLVRGFLQGLGHVGAVKSPTYTLLEPYEIEGVSYCHIDLYRLANAGELEYLGLRDLLQEGATMLVEWPEKGQGELPAPDIVVNIKYMQLGRILEFVAETELGKRILQALSETVRKELNN